MTDQETLYLLFTNRGMTVDLHVHSPECQGRWHGHNNESQIMYVQGGTAPGYTGFESAFEFDLDGKLIGVGGVE